MNVLNFVVCHSQSVLLSAAKGAFLIIRLPEVAIDFVQLKLVRVL